MEDASEIEAKKSKLEATKGQMAANKFVEGWVYSLWTPKGNTGKEAAQTRTQNLRRKPQEASSKTRSTKDKLI